MSKKVSTGVKEGRFEELVTPSPTLSPAKEGVEQD